MQLPIPSRFDRGLREDVPAGAMEIGYASIAKGVEFNSTTGPRTRLGYRRLAADQPDATAVRLDGNNNCIIIDPTDTGGSNLVLTNNFLFVAQFVLRSHEPGTTNPGSFVWDYSEGTLETVNLRLFARLASGEARFAARVTNAAGSMSSQAASSIPVQLGKFYTVGVRYGGTSSNENLEIMVFGEESWQAASTLGGALFEPSGIGTDLHVHVGAIARDQTALDQGNGASRILRCSAIDIHRIRAWDDSNNNLEPDTTETPIFDYRFTERGTQSFVDSIGAAPDAYLVSVGQQTFTVGADRVQHQPSATWETTSPIVGDAGLDFDGYTNFIRVENAVLYRRWVPPIDTLEDDSDTLEYEELTSYGIVTVVSFSDLSRDQTIAHYAPVREMSSEASADPDDSSPDYYWVLRLDYNGGSPRIAFSVGDSTSTDYEIVTSSITLAADTAYLIAATRDSVSGDMSLRIATDSSDWDEEVTDSGAPTTVNDPVAGNKNDDRSTKYCMILGCGVEIASFDTRQNDPNDPNDFRLRLNYLTMFKGQMGTFMFLAMERETDGSGTIPNEALLQLIDAPFNTETITGLAGQLRIRSAWFMDEGLGSEIIDSGLIGNDITFQELVDRNYVRSQASYTLEEASPSSIDSVSEVFDTYKGRRLIAIAGAMAYEVNSTNETLDFVADGFRNDAGNKVFSIPYRRSILLTAGNRPYRLLGDDIFPVGVERLDSSKIRWGLIQQGYEPSGLRAGIYRYRFVYFSAITQEEGDYDAEIQVRVPRSVKANVVFGATSSDETTADSLDPQIRTNQESGEIDSVNTSPFDITDGVDPWQAAIINIVIEGGGPGGSGNTHDQTIRIERSDVDDPEKVTALELARIIRRKGEFIRAGAVRGDTILRLLSSYVGAYASGSNTGGRITINQSTPDSDESDLYDVLGYAGTSIVSSGSDGGNSTQPLPIPNNSPQVTHIRIYRTAKDGDTFRFVGEIPIGEANDGYAGGRYFIDQVNNSDIAFRRPQNDQSGVLPECTMMAEVLGFVFYAGDPDHPERLWFAQGREYRVAPVNFVDVLAGGTRAITGLQRYGTGGVLIFKEHATLVLTFTSSPVLPFRIELRKPGVGALGPFGIENVDNQLAVADAQYPRIFDSINYFDIGYQIFQSWGEISEDVARNIHTTYWPREQLILFADEDSNTSFVYFLRKRAWAKWDGFPYRCGSVAQESSRLNRLVFGDRFGNVFEIGAEQFHDGGEWILDATKINEALTGTGFTVLGSGTTVDITAWTLAQSDGAYIRGAKLLLNDGTNEEMAYVSYVNSSGEIVLEDALTTISDATYASGTFSFCGIDQEFRSGGIRSNDTRGLQLRQWFVDMEREDGWPSSHTVTFTANIRSGSAAPGELTKVTDSAIDDLRFFFPFLCREFRWGFRQSGPNKPVSISNINFEADSAAASRPF